MNIDGDGVAGEESPADALTDVLQARARTAAVADAALLDAVVAVADRNPWGFDSDLVAFTLRWTQVTARAHVEFGRYLQRVIKPVWVAMCAGDLDVPRARVFHDVLATVDDDIAFGIALDFVDRAPGLDDRSVAGTAAPRGMQSESGRCGQADRGQRRAAARLSDARA